MARHHPNPRPCDLCGEPIVGTEERRVDGPICGLLDLECAKLADLWAEELSAFGKLCLARGELRSQVEKLDRHGVRAPAALAKWMAGW